MIGLYKCESSPRQRKLLDELEDFTYRVRGSMVMKGGNLYVLLNHRAVGKRTRARYGVLMINGFCGIVNSKVVMMYVRRELRKFRRRKRNDDKKKADLQMGAFI